MGLVLPEGGGGQLQKRGVVAGVCGGGDWCVDVRATSVTVPVSISGLISEILTSQLPAPTTRLMHTTQPRVSLAATAGLVWSLPACIIPSTGSWARSRGPRETARE